MSSLKSKGFTLLLLVLVYIWFFVGHLPSFNQDKTNVLSAQTDVSVFIQPDSGKSPIINEINNAQHEILVEVYLLSDKDVISSLCIARKRGLAVDVMLEQHPFGGGNLNNNSRNNLLACDVSVNWTNPSFALTHEKTITIDQKEVFILNQNLTASSFTKNREFDVLDRLPNDVFQVRQIFISDWERKNYNISSSNLVISPINSRSAIEQIINSSKKSLDIESEDINDDEIVSLLIQKSKNEKVRILTPTISQISSNKKSLDQLAQAGVEVKTVSSPYIHAKLILVDGKNAFIGSENLSSQSLDKNREVGISIAEVSSLSTLQDKFNSDWESAKDY